MAMTVREAAILRMAMADEGRQLRQNMPHMNIEQIGAAYPRMLYRATDVPDVVVISHDREGRPRETQTVNLCNGLLCDTMVVDSVDEAEALAASGWDTSPEAAHGQVSGMVAATTAKDEENAALRAEIEALKAAMAAEPPKRGPGRPPREPVLQSEE